MVTRVEQPAEWGIIEEWNLVPPIAASASKRRDSNRIIRVPSEVKSKLSEHGMKEKTRSPHGKIFCTYS